jgi:predicted RNA-binding Zn-ribbon protein involved in translation (DUF1610 family)
MVYCPNCRKHFREPEEEQGEHPCPKCGRGPEWYAKQEEEEDEPYDCPIHGMIGGVNGDCPRC